MSDIHKLLHTIVTVKAIFHPFCLITGTFWFFIILSFRFVICGWCEFAVFLGLASYVDFLSADLIWCLRVSAGPRGIGGGSLVGRVNGSTRASTSLSEVYPVGKLQWHFTCGFDFRHSMIAICGRFCSSEGVINSSCGNYGSFLTWRKPFPDFFLGGGTCGLCPKSSFHRVRALRPPTFRF